MNDLLKDYYKSKLSLEILTLEVKEKQEAVMAFLESQPEGKAEIPQAKFVIRKTPVYGFGFLIESMEEKVKMLKEKIKVAQKEAIETGTAKVVSETKVVMMVKTKEK